MSITSNPAAERGAIKRSLRTFPSLRAVGALMLREMATSYGRSPGGYLWAILEPVAGVLIFTMAFGLLLTAPPIGTSFELFYATGVLPFTIFVNIANKVGTSIIFSKSLLSLPAVTYLDAIIARFVLNLLTELLIFYIIIFAIFMIKDLRIAMDTARIAQSLGLVSLFALGVGTANAFLFMRFPIWHVFWALINRPLFIISGVFFTYENLPQSVQAPLWYNPLIHIVGVMRAGFYPTYDEHFVSEIYVALLSLGLLAFGLLMLSAHARRLIEQD